MKKVKSKEYDTLKEFDNFLYKTEKGIMILGEAEKTLKNLLENGFKNKVQLIFSSPPFPLNRKKKYGNLNGNEYVEWFVKFGSIFKELLKPNGSIVMELGNAWEKNKPTISTLSIKALLRFQEGNKLKLCQEFIYFNPARLPTPVQWVNVERIRVKDSFTRLWWMSLKNKPYARNKNVLIPYSSSMQTLLKTKKYNAGKRPSEHNIGKKSFIKDNGGAIPPNVLIFANTADDKNYINYCNRKNCSLHPARMPKGIAEFFIKFLTKKGDIVLDPFAGSNITGYTAECLERRWVSVEMLKEYAMGSKGRFTTK